jgi:hypothetical protein
LCQNKTKETNKQAKKKRRKKEKKTCTPMSIAVLFTTVKLWNQAVCSTTSEWIKKVQYINTSEYYSAIKKTEIMLFAEKWVELEVMMLIEISQAQKDKYHIFSLLC